MKNLLLIGAFGAMMVVGGCAKGAKSQASMGEVSSEKGACCKDKAAGECCKNKDKAAMGAVSGSSCSEKKDCSAKCSASKQ